MKTKLFILIGTLVLLCNFFAAAYTLTLDMDSAHGSITVNGTAYTSTQYLTVSYGQQVTMEANNDEAGYVFEQWGASYQGQTQNPYTVTIYSDVYVEPTFKVDDTPSDDLNLTGNLSVDGTSLLKGAVQSYDSLTIKPDLSNHYQYALLNPTLLKLGTAGHAAQNVELGRTGMISSGPGGTYKLNSDGLTILKHSSLSQLSFDTDTRTLSVKSWHRDDSGETTIKGGQIATSQINADRITAEEITVAVDAHPDYVFKEGYDLKSLDEVDDFIKANGHLPGIPSEKEVMEGGVKLGEMQTKLLEKIEELTLHMIDMQDKIDNLEQQVAQ